MSRIEWKFAELVVLAKAFIAAEKYTPGNPWLMLFNTAQQSLPEERRRVITTRSLVPEDFWFIKETLERQEALEASVKVGFETAMQQAEEDLRKKEHQARMAGYEEAQRTFSPENMSLDVLMAELGRRLVGNQLVKLEQRFQERIVNLENIVLEAAMTLEEAVGKLANLKVSTSTNTATEVSVVVPAKGERSAKKPRLTVIGVHPTLRNHIEKELGGQAKLRFIDGDHVQELRHFRQSPSPGAVFVGMVNRPQVEGILSGMEFQVVTRSETHFWIDILKSCIEMEVEAG